ncbi:gamma-glutamyl-gamma-aminobutyrate hydrolase family protein [Breoghania sp. JC706]|uniref:gamma-glutamyl-gamma-aminobutyrate hydrolase family protein n=1 Tax=Breoghania sp. JC706 TaxID=3117732 RepID=UPI00300B9655
MSIIAVSQRVDDFPDRRERRDATDQRLMAFLATSGLQPVAIPNGLVPDMVSDDERRRALDLWIAAIRPSALVLSGGNDIGSCPDRDLTESHLLDLAARNPLPVLGICRGMQMMAVHAGTALKTVDGHVRTRHRLREGADGEVNSYHTLSLSGCPDGFMVTARAGDGEIEAIRHRNQPWEGWMWHPEREAPFAETDIANLRTLFAGCHA